MRFRFDGSYRNEEQVAGFLPVFEQLHAGIVAAGQYPYNDSFKGLIPGIEGPDEDTAIYLLQGLRRSREQAAKAAELLAAGYKEIETLDQVSRFRHVVLIPTRRMGGEWAEFEDARIVPDANGKPYGVLRKGKRTHGTLISGRKVLVSPK